jgi:hypothetical protein
MRATFVWMLLLVLAVMGGLGLLRFPFALRFWRRMRRLGYLYVAFVVLLAVITIAFGHHL